MNDSPFPARDRRSGTRILTRRNALWFGLAVLICFTVITVASEFGHRKGDGPGRLWASREAHTNNVTVSRPAPPIIHEAPAPGDQTYADAMSVDTINREQVLGVNGVPVSAAAARDAQLRAATTPAITVAPSQKLGFEHPDAVSSGQTKHARFSISGGAGGIQAATATH